MEEPWALCAALTLTSTLDTTVAAPEAIVRIPLTHLENSCLPQLLRAQEIPRAAHGRITSIPQIRAEVGRKGERKMFVSFTIFKESVRFCSFKMTFRKSVHMKCVCLKQ